MSTFVLLTITGLGLGAMYFLIASGLSLIYGLMGVLNFAHGAFLTVGAYAHVVHRDELDGIARCWPRFLARRARWSASSSAASFAALVELVLIRPLYQRHIEQVLVTVGLALAIVALVTAIWGNDAQPVRRAGVARRDDDGRSARTSRTTAGSRSRPPSSCSSRCTRSCGARATG